MLIITNLMGINLFCLAQNLILFMLSIKNTRISKLPNVKKQKIRYSALFATSTELISK